MSKNGYRVIRGPNWMYGNQNKSAGTIGTIVDTEDKRVRVDWSTQNSGKY